jgi:glucuronoarabinoxylan endo-1,4-beta-xylanase
MKSNDNVNNGGYVQPAFYGAYATYLATYSQHYESAFGLHISGISIANEPDITASYESSNWTSQQFHDFIAGYVMPTFQSAGVKTRVMLPELSGWSDDAAAATLADPATAKFVGVVNSHDYWGTLAPFLDARAANLPVWETEVSNLGTDDPSIQDGLQWAQNIHNCLVNAQVNAWHYWWLYANFSDTTGQSLISGDPTKNTFITKKRLWTIGNYSRFVRPGWHMLGVSSNNPESGVYVTAFSGPGGQMSIVAINTNATSTDMMVNTGQSKLPFAFVYRTSATEDLRETGLLFATAQKFTATLAPQSVTTLKLWGLLSVA